MNCIDCGSATVEGQREDGVTTWRCPKCGRTVIDAVGAEWKGGTYPANEVRLSTDGKEICAMIGENPIEESLAMARLFTKRCKIWQTNW